MIDAEQVGTKRGRVHRPIVKCPKCGNRVVIGKRTKRMQQHTVPGPDGYRVTCSTSGAVVQVTESRVA